MSLEDLHDILKISYENNKDKNITGILLYRGGNFLQVLEGEQEVVEALYEKIKKDPRHRDVMTVSKRQIEQREFNGWEMGFVNLDTLRADQMPEGYSDFLMTPLSQEDLNRKKSFIWTFVNNFRDLMR
jgi:hypothetical protein